MCAGFFVRWMAYIIDTVIATLAVSIVKLPLELVAGSLTFLQKNFLFHFTIIDVIAYLGVAAYFVLLTYFAHTTLGKMLFRLEVVTKNKSWSFLNILYRETIGRFLSSLLYIGYLAAIVTKEHQGFHDMLCDTCVVYRNMQRIPTGKPVAGTPVQAPVTTSMPTPTSGQVLSTTPNPVARQMTMPVANATVESTPAEKSMIVAPVYHSTKD